MGGWDSCDECTVFPFQGIKTINVIIKSVFRLHREINENT